MNSKKNFKKTYRRVILSLLVALAVFCICSSIGIVKTYSEESTLLEINQGFSYKNSLEQEKGAKLELCENFVASKAFYLMFEIEDSKVDEAKANWKVEIKKGDEIIETVAFTDASAQNYYDHDSEVVKGRKLLMKKCSGLSEGSYTFLLKNADTIISKRENMHFRKTKDISILVIPCNSYYSVATEGGCPKDKIKTSVPCDPERLKTIKTEIETYMYDTYPSAKIEVSMGAVLDAGNADYDMCSKDGWRKLWEEACKYMVKGRDGKDQYDRIVALVQYRQGEDGSTQGFTYGSPANIVTLSDKDSAATVAHEIAHSYDVGDEYNGGSYNCKVNLLPMYENAEAPGRDIITGEEAPDIKKYILEKLLNGNDKNNYLTSEKYYWVNPEQYMKQTDINKEKIDIFANGNVIYPDLHPLRLSTGSLVHFTEENYLILPTLGFMGSGFDSTENYFNTQVIWEHLYLRLCTGNKCSSGEEKDTEAFVDDSVLSYGEGESKIVEVAGEMCFENNVAKSIEMNPLFTYESDLATLFMPNAASDMVLQSNLYWFVALDGNGKMMDSKVSGIKSAITFECSSFNPSMTGDLAKLDKVYFNFDAEYPKGSKAFAVIRYDEFDTDKSYTKDNTLWFRSFTEREVYGGFKSAELGKDSVTITWMGRSYENAEDTVGKADDIYAKIYYAPLGDEGDLLYVMDGKPDIFEKKDTDYLTYSFKTSDYNVTPNNKAYVFVKLSDGVNSAYLYSDMKECYIKDDSDKKDVTPTPTASPTPGPDVTPTPSSTPDPKLTPTPGAEMTPTPTPVEVSKLFTDVDPAKWYSKEDGPIRYAIDNGIMEGTSKTTFEPEKLCTRTMMVKILYNAEGAPNVTGVNPFTDVASGKWYYNAVIWASQNKVTSGYADGRFGINDDVTRQQMAKFLLNYAGFKGYDVSARADLSSYPDNGSISSWAVDAMKWANANGIINGKKDKNGNLVLNPQGGATRAEVAQMIMNFQKKFGK